MGAWKRVLVHVAWSGLFFSGLVGLVLPAAAQTTESQPSAITYAAPAVTASAISELPDSPGATVAKLAVAVPLQSTQDQSAQSQSAQNQSPAIQLQQPAPQKPVGTAAAEAPNASGIAASQPAGVAIAPGKQHRARTIVLRVGAIIGAGVAVGTVVGLTEATSSKPPGAH
jgi:hypothetical protein